MTSNMIDETKENKRSKAELGGLLLMTAGFQASTNVIGAMSSQIAEYICAANTSEPPELNGYGFCTKLFAYVDEPAIPHNDKLRILTHVYYDLGMPAKEKSTLMLAVLKQSEIHDSNDVQTIEEFLEGVAQLTETEKGRIDLIAENAKMAANHVRSGKEYQKLMQSVLEPIN